MFFIGVVFVVLITLIFLYLLVKELLCSYRNPFPLFRNGDKRFNEIMNNAKEYKTRSILKDSNYDL